MTTRKGKGWKIAGVIFLALLLIICTVLVWISHDYERILHEKAPKWIAKGTDSAYKVSFEDVDINIFTRNVTLEGVNIWPDSAYIKTLDPEKAPAVTYNISIPSLDISGIQWSDIIADKDVIFSRLTIRNPVVAILSSPKPEDSLEQKPRESKKDPKIEKIHADEIIITNPNIHFQQKDTAKTAHYHAKGGKIALYNWELNPGKHATSGRFLFSESAEITLDSFLHTSDEGLYNISSSKLAFSTKEKKFSAENLRVKTTMDKDKFYAKKGHQSDMFDIEFPRVTVNGLEWQLVLDSNQLIVKSIELERGRFDDYFTRLAPPNPNSKMGNFPNQMLLKLPLPIYIPEIRIKSGSMSYTEVNEKSKRPGRLQFSNVNGTVTNATNMPEHIAKDGNCTLDLKSNFNGKSPVHAVFKLSLKDTSGAFTVDGVLQDLDAPQVNDAAKALALARIDSLHISKLTMHIEADETYAKGKVTVLYNKLKVSLLDTTREWRKIALEEKETLSFLANNLILYPSNPMPGEAIRSETGEMKRDPYRSFFSLIWKTIFNSAQKTAIRSDIVEEAIEESQMNKGKKKLGLFKRVFGRKKGKAK